MGKEAIIEYFKAICSDKYDGITKFITRDTNEIIFDTLIKMETEKIPLSLIKLNQCFALARLRTVSDGFFKYYWLSANNEHFYNIYKTAKTNKLDLPSGTKKDIDDIKILYSGLYRIFLDCLYCFGNIKFGFNQLCSKSYEELCNFFKSMRIDTDMIIQRGSPLEFDAISPDDKYLISETVYKNFGDDPNRYSETQLEKFLLESYKAAKKKNISRIKISDLFSGKYIEASDQVSIFSDGFGEDEVSSEEEIKAKVADIAKIFFSTRKKALNNTKLYLSFVNDLDVYVATSMRTKKDFIDIHNFIESLKKNEKIKTLGLRYFDPTMSAAEGHENKGIIECLMVKASRVLIYIAGEKDSYGKAAEAAMALSLGKPVIFFCNTRQKEAFFRDVHPLSRLVNFENGVVGGAIVCTTPQEVADTIDRIYRNDMVYSLVQADDKPGHYCIKDSFTNSTIRVQTDDRLLTSSFWNLFGRKHNKLESKSHD